MATRTSSFGVGKREAHDSSAYYKRALSQLAESKDRLTNESVVENEIFEQSAETMSQLPDNSVALMITSPPYHVGKDYDSNATFEEYLDLLDAVFR